MSKADDIRNFQIEGISIGGSLLKIFTENEILSNIVDYSYKSDKFTIFEIVSPSKFENYESLQVAFLKQDKNFIIYSISAAIFYDNKIDQCEKKKEIIFKALKKLLKIHIMINKRINFLVIQLEKVLILGMLFTFQIVSS